MEKYPIYSKKLAKIIRTKQFKKWLGDWEKDPQNVSKIVDENGEPQIVYHWTNAKFDTFRDENLKTGWLWKWLYFTANKALAKEYGKVMLETFLNIRNPMSIQGDSPSDFIKETNHLDR